MCSSKTMQPLKPLPLKLHAIKKRPVLLVAAMTTTTTPKTSKDGGLVFLNPKHSFAPVSMLPPPDMNIEDDDDDEDFILTVPTANINAVNKQTATRRRLMPKFSNQNNNMVEFSFCSTGYVSPSPCVTTTI